jgi:hypothetical protein
MAIGAQAPYAYRQPSVSGAIWRLAGAYGRLYYRYSVYRYNNTGIIGKNRYLRYILAIFYTAGTV